METNDRLTKDEQRHKMQNERILGEFPWLWAIRPMWILSQKKVIIKDAEKNGKEFREFLDSKIPDFHKPRIWLHLEGLTKQADCYRRFTREIRLRYRITFKHAILEDPYIKNSSERELIRTVMIDIDEPVELSNPVNIILYRLKKPLTEKSLQDLK